MEYSTNAVGKLSVNMEELLNGSAETLAADAYMATTVPPNTSNPGLRSNAAMVFQYRVVPSFYLILCVVGLFGNGVVISVLWSIMSRNTLKSVTDILVINLAFADFIFVGSLPFWATELFMQNSWVFGNVGCKLLSFITLLNLYGSVFFLVAMGIDRYLAVVYAVRAINYRTPRKAVIACIVIWAAASLVGMQALIWRETHFRPDKNVTNCVWKTPTSFMTAYYVIRMAFGFFVPFVIIVYCYILIIMKLNRRVSTRLSGSSLTNKQRKITRAILGVISLFVVCWLPNHIVTLINALTVNNKDLRDRLGLSTAGLVSVCMAYANSAINPILYAFMKEEIRQEGTEMILRLFVCCRRSGSRIRTSRRFFSFWKSNNSPTMVTTVPQKNDICVDGTGKKMSTLQSPDIDAEAENSGSNMATTPGITQLNGENTGEEFEFPLDPSKVNLVVNIDEEKFEESLLHES